MQHPSATDDDSWPEPSDESVRHPSVQHPSVRRRRVETSRRVASPQARERLDALIARTRERSVPVDRAESLRQPPTRLLRFRPSARVLVTWAVLAVAGLIAVVALVPDDRAPSAVSVMVSGTPTPYALDDPEQAQGGPGGVGETGAGPAGGDVVVHVIGAVRRPGLVRLPEGSLADDAIRAAGGPADDAALESLNLAEPVRSGQQIRVMTKEQSARLGQVSSGGQGGASSSGASPAPTGAGDDGSAASGQAGAAGAQIDLNAASIEELQQLPRVGPKLAQRIVDWRTEHGPFRSVDELDAVPGIGPAMMSALKPLVSVR